MGALPAHLEKKGAVSGGRSLPRCEILIYTDVGEGWVSKPSPGGYLKRPFLPKEAKKENKISCRGQRLDVISKPFPMCWWYSLTPWLTKADEALSPFEGGRGDETFPPVSRKFHPPNPLQRGRTPYTIVLR